MGNYIQSYPELNGNSRKEPENQGLSQEWVVNRKLPTKRLERPRRLPAPYPKPNEKDFDMTVCIAVIYYNGGVVAVSDKMLSTADATFEPDGDCKKIFRLFKTIHALNAGHVGLQAEIMQSMVIPLISIHNQNPQKEFTVVELVDLYVEHYNHAKRQRINNSIFAQYNLDLDSFLARQKEFSDIFTRDLMDQVARFQMPETATIIAGVDKSAGVLEPHIYCIKGGYDISVECCDAVGYATIGSGARLAEAQFMQANFNRHFELPKALFLSYLAKRHAEKAPGVGKETEMFLLGPDPDSIQNLQSVLDYKKLDEMYNEIVSQTASKTDQMYVKTIELLLDKVPERPRLFS